MNYGESFDSSTGRRIINVSAHKSNNFAQTSITPGQKFNQVFDSEPKSYGQTAKHASFVEPSQVANNQRTLQSSNLKGGMGSTQKVRDSDAFANLVNHAIQNTDDKRNTPSLYGGNTLNQASAASLPNLYSKDQINESNTYVSEHTTQHISGLTEFLRSEYHRKFGCFINGARDEESKLISFWRDNISEEARKKRERLVEQKREKLVQEQNKDIQNDRNTLNREFQKLMAEKFRSTEPVKSQRPSTAKKLESGKKENPWYPPKRGAIQAASSATSHDPTKSAVPFAFSETAVQNMYEKFSKCHDLSVGYTIHQDLTQENEKDIQLRLQQEEKFMIKTQEEQKKYEQKVIEEMLKLYFFPPQNPIKETKKDFESPKKKSTAQSNEIKIDVKKRLASLSQDKKPAPTKEELENQMDFMLKVLLLAKEKKKYMTNLPNEVLLIYKESGSRYLFGDSDVTNAEKQINEFFKAKSFIKRLQLHMMHICKSKTKQQTTLTLYFAGLRQQEKEIYLLDYQKSEGNGDKGYDNKTPEEVIFKYMDDKKKKTEKIEKQKLEQKLKKEEERKAKDRIDKGQVEPIKPAPRDPKTMTPQEIALEKKKEQERINKYFTELSKPKDRFEKLKELYLLASQFPHDPIIRKMLNEELIINPDAPEEFFKKKEIERFSNREAGEKRAAFEKALMQEAQLFFHDSKKRPQESQVKDLKQAITDAYKKMLKDHKEVMSSQYKMKSDVEFTFDSKTFSVHKNPFPELFKRHFFKKLKLCDSSLRPYLPKTDKKVRNTRRKPPMMFMNGGSRRCVLHTVSCPTQPCPYASLNKKIMLTRLHAKQAAKEVPILRQRIFGRQELKERFKKIFMTNDEQINCQFIPIISKIVENKPTDAKPQTFDEKFGKNFIKSDPAIYKKGILKKAQREYREGRYMTAFNTLQTAFNIESIKNFHDPQYYKNKMKQALADRFTKKKKDEKKGTEKIDHLREKTEDKQKNMCNEDFEKAKLKPLLEEAYNLILLIEEKTTNMDAIKMKLEKQKQKLIKDRKEFQDAEHIDDLQEMLNDKDKYKLVFKTIMCPLGDRCSKVNYQRWPKSSTKCVTPLGRQCLYAHHYNELIFPETLDSKIAALEKMKTSAAQTAETELKLIKGIFKPPSVLKDCQGCHGCQYCIFKRKTKILSKEEQLVKNFKYAKMMKKAENKSTTDYINEMREMKKTLKEENLDIDDQYFVKFGLLKKATVLLYYERVNDAFDEIAKAVEIGQKQKKHDEDKARAIQARWSFKLGIDEGTEIPKEWLTVHPDLIPEKRIKEFCDTAGIPLSTLRLYVEKISPALNDQYSKNVYLDQSIEEVYLLCETKIQKQKENIENIKTKVAKLDEEAEDEDMYGDGEEPPEILDEDGKPKKRKVNKKKMCESILKTGKCKFTSKNCKFAHNPIELNLVTKKETSENLSQVVQSLDKSMRANKSVRDWNPPSDGGIADLSLFQPYLGKTLSSKDEKDKKEDEDDEKKPKRVWQRENVFRKPYEELE